MDLIAFSREFAQLASHFQINLKLSLLRIERKIRKEGYIKKSIHKINAADMPTFLDSSQSGFITREFVFHEYISK